MCRGRSRRWQELVSCRCGPAFTKLSERYWRVNSLLLYMFSRLAYVRVSEEFMLMYVCSQDPYLAGQMSANSIQGLQQNGDYANSTAACLKHFLGYPAPKVSAVISLYCAMSDFPIAPSRAGRIAQRHGLDNTKSCATLPLLFRMPSMPESSRWWLGSIYVFVPSPSSWLPSGEQWQYWWSAGAFLVRVPNHTSSQRDGVWRNGL